MKLQHVSFLLLIAFALCLTSCEEPKRPIDYPNSSWTCEVASISFTVSSDSIIHDATMLNKYDEAIAISLVFADMESGKVSITNADRTEIYLSGTCTYGNDTFSIFLTDIFSSDIDITTTRLTFERN